MDIGGADPPSPIEVEEPDRTQLEAGIESQETQSRRVLELRLLQNYLSNTSGATDFPYRQQRGIRTAWSTAVMESIIHHECLLYAIYAMSAENLATQADPTTTESVQLTEASRRYMVLALSAQRHAVSELSAESAMAVCHASSLILQNSFSMLRGRSVEQYEPPMNWFHMGQGTSAVFVAVFDIIRQENAIFTNPLLRLVDPQMQEPGMCDSVDSESMLILTQPDPADDADDFRAYEGALMYVSFIQRCINRGDEEWPCSLRFLCWPVYVPRRFVELVGAQRPRALTILARALTLAAQMTTRWWTASARAELAAVGQQLSPEWSGLL